MDRRQWLRNYHQTCLETDLRELVRLHQPESFDVFERLTAPPARAGSLVNLSAVAGEAHARGYLPGVVAAGSLLHANIGRRRNRRRIAARDGKTTFMAEIKAGCRLGLPQRYLRIAPRIAALGERSARKRPQCFSTSAGSSPPFQFSSKASKNSSGTRSLEAQAATVL